GQFSKILESVQRGPLVYSAENNMPFGKAWNTGANEGNLKSFGRWAAEIPGIIAGTSIEIPYANVSGKAITPETARAFGHDLARALRVFLEQSEKK
ncbi:peptidase M14, partial [Candidatus Sumerlaeota bacterium]|nr:peptidase M14 [Candidatus Sumerlaeota bacterium]